MKRGLCWTLVLLSVIAGASSAYAQQSTVIRYATHLPPTADGVLQGAKVFVAAAQENESNKLTVQLYPGEQAGKATQMFDLVKSGAVDIGQVSSSLLSSDKVPLLGILEAPGLANNTCGVVKAMSELTSPGGAIYETELKPNGIRIIAIMPYPPYGPAASRTAISKVEDLKGMKMRNAGGLMELTVGKLGGAPVKMPSTEVFQALQRGTIDTVLFSFLSVKEYSLPSIVNFGVTGFSFGTPGDVLIMSERRLQSLTAGQRDALIAAGKRTSEHWCKFVDETEAKNISDMKAAGMKIHAWSAADVAKLKELTSGVAKDWAAGLDARGKPGTKVLEAFASAVGK